MCTIPVVDREALPETESDSDQNPVGIPGSQETGAHSFGGFRPIHCFNASMQQYVTPD